MLVYSRTKQQTKLLCLPLVLEVCAQADTLLIDDSVVTYHPIFQVVVGVFGAYGELCGKQEVV